MGSLTIWQILKKWVIPAKTPTALNPETLGSSPFFCIMPWVHLHLTEKGTVTPCCLAPWDEKQAFGNINRESIAQIWNGEPIAEFRKQLLHNQADARCTRCYEKERKGGISLRQSSNKDFAHHLERVWQTLPDGKFAQPEQQQAIYLDLRFSNLCNFSCRICGPWASSKWFNDAQAMGLPVGDKALTFSSNDAESLFAQLSELLPHVEHIYFAGGEPLLMEQHYRILDWLIEHQHTKLKLRYSTNFLEMRFKGKSIFEWWQQFDNVLVCASLDDHHERVELQRKGIAWERIVNNRLEMMRLCPHVKFIISATVSVFNVFNLPNFHREWTEKGLIEVGSFFPNPLDQPAYYNIGILPSDMKQVIVQRYTQHIQWIEAQHCTDKIDQKLVVQAFESCMAYLNDRDLSHLLPEFRQKTYLLDALRGENTAQTLPELHVLLAG